MHTDNVQETLSVGQIGAVIRRNGTLILILICLSSIVALCAASFLSHKYKSKSILSIQSSYFQHPLVSDVLSNVQDPSEMSALRLSLLRLSLTDQFLDKLANKYRIYETSDDEISQVLNRELFLKRIEYFSVSPSNFQISIVTENANTAFAAMKDILAQMTDTVIEKRFQALMRARQAILTQAQMLSSTLAANKTAPLRETLEAKLSTMELNLEALRTRYADTHPDVLKVKDLTNALASRIDGLADRQISDADDYTKIFLSPSSRTTSQEIFDDLLKKLSHLNIVLEMERDRQNVSYLGVIEQPSLPTKAFYPDPVRFALLGSVIGLVLAGIMVTVRELRRGDILSPDQAAEFLGIELLGELPKLTLRERLLLIDAPSKQVFALPPPSLEN